MPNETRRARIVKVLSCAIHWTDVGIALMALYLIYVLADRVFG